MGKIADIGTDFFGYSHVLTTGGGLSKFVGTIVQNLIAVAGVLLLILIVYSGVSMVTSAGNPQSFERARNNLTSAIIGFIIVVAAWFIVQAIQTSTGFTNITN
jgi:hypothetical protein